MDYKIAYNATIGSLLILLIVAYVLNLTLSDIIILLVLMIFMSTLIPKETE